MKQATPSHDAYAALRLAVFRRYFAGNGILFLGLQMQKVAVGWEIYERTGSALHLGYAGLVQFFPIVGFSLIAGHVTDTYNRKRVLIAAVALTTIAAVGLAWNSATYGSVALMYVFLFATGTARAFWLPARASFLPRLVPRETFANAVSWNSTSFELASIVGPAIGGLLIGFFQSALLVYLVNVIAATTFLFLILGIPYRHQVAEREPVSFRSLSAGIRYIHRTPVVLAAMTLDMFGVLLGGATALMPVFAKDILKVGALGLGWLLAAPSLGAVSMAMIQAHRPPTRRAGRKLLLAVAGFGTATLLFGISHNFWFSLAMLFFLGVFDNISVVIRSTLIQMLTPDEMRGRVSAINSMFIGTSNELGGFESGVLAGVFGPVISVVTGGVGAIIVVCAVAWMWPQLRQYKELGGPC